MLIKNNFLRTHWFKGLMYGLYKNINANNNMEIKCQTG